jgi:chemotaxis protein histidine kinase CheA
MKVRETGGKRPVNNFQIDDVDSEFMREMQQLYLEHTTEKVETFHSVFSQIKGDPTDHKLLYEGYRLSHSLAGGAASYGFETAAEIGRRMEDLLEDAYEKRLTLTTRHFDFLDSLVSRLNEYFQLAHQGGIDSMVQIPELNSFLNQPSQV